MRTFFVVLCLVGCGDVEATKPDATTKADAAVGTDAPADARMVDVPMYAPGSQENPAASCVALKNVNAASGVYWLKDAGGVGFQTYCDQDTNGGGWALVYRSMLTANGTTTAFFRMTRAQRFDYKGSPSPSQNFYAGTVYKLGRDYMDTITDLQNKTVIAAAVTTSGVVETTMIFQGPVLVSGNTEIFGSQFAAGWSASDHDGDTFGGGNCADFGGGIAQHYTACFVYSIGADGETPYEDGGVGPHVLNTALANLGLAAQPNGGQYSRVNMIARYARW